MPTADFKEFQTIQKLIVYQRHLRNSMMNLLSNITMIVIGLARKFSKSYVDIFFIFFHHRMTSVSNRRTFTWCFWRLCHFESLEHQRSSTGGQQLVVARLGDKSGRSEMFPTRLQDFFAGYSFWQFHATQTFHNCRYFW